MDKKNFLAGFLANSVSNPPGPVGFSNSPPANLKKRRTVQNIATKSIRDTDVSQDTLFTRRLEEQGKEPLLLPSYKDVLGYVKSLPLQPLWFVNSQMDFERRKDIHEVQQPILTREYLMRFYEWPKKGEQTCKHPRCESERLSKRRLRVLRIPGIPEEHCTWCLMCIWSWQTENIIKTINHQQSDDLFTLHLFGVMVNVPGEYRLDRCFPPDKDLKGLRVPVPIYNVNNYAQTDKGWVEDDDLVFRLPQTPPL